MAHVLDSVCIFYIFRNIFGCVFVVVPILLWSQSDHGHLAAVASHRGQFYALSQLRTSDADETGKGMSWMLFSWSK